MNHEPCKIEHIDATVVYNYSESDRFCGFLIRERHTTADIARLIIDQGWEDEIMEYLGNPEFVAKAKGQ